MKRLIITFITIVLFSLSVLTASAASADFTVLSAEVQPNRIVSLDVNCSRAVDLASAIFEFYYDRSALEFRGCGSADGIIVKSVETDNCVRAVYFNKSKAAVTGGNIFQFKFKTVKEGSYDISFKVSQCVDFTPNEISIGNCAGGTVKVSKNAPDNGMAVENDSTKTSPGSNKSGKSNFETSSKGKANNTSEADERSEPENLGELTDIVEKPAESAVILYILIGLGVLLLIASVIKIGMMYSAEKKDKTDKN